jgi:transketolase
MVDAAIEAKALLANEGVNVKVINIHTLKPIDQELIIKSAKETGAVVTAEEHSIIGGLGSAVAEVLAENYPVPVLRVGINDTFGESGKPDELLKAYNLTSEDIVAKVKKAIALKK